MGIAINTSPANAISSISDLVLEVRDEMDDSNFTLDRIYRAIARAEAVFNRELRTPQMETDALLELATEVTDLPNDFLQMRTIYREGDPDSPFVSMSPAGLRSFYSGVNGNPQAYALENRRILIGPVGAATVKMVYFARIPALTEDNPSNWLLDENPDLYLHQVLAILYNKIGDSDRAALNQNIADVQLQRLSNAGQSARWGAGPLVPAGMRQVRGARA